MEFDYLGHLEQHSHNYSNPCLIPPIPLPKEVCLLSKNYLRRLYEYKEYYEFNQYRDLHNTSSVSFKSRLSLEKQIKFSDSVYSQMFLYDFQSNSQYRDTFAFYSSNHYNNKYPRFKSYKYNIF